MLEIYRCPCSTVESFSEWAERQTDNVSLINASMGSMSNIIYQGQLSWPSPTWANPYHTRIHKPMCMYTHRGWDRMAMITFNIYSCLNYS